MVRFVIIDDHPLFREGVVRTLAVETDLTVVGEGSTAEDAVRATGALQPDLLLLDLDIPGGGLAALAAIHAVAPATRIVILTADGREGQLLAALQRGAHAYVLKGVSARELARVLRSVHAGQGYVPPELAARLLSPPAEAPPPAASPLGELTERERQILRMVARGSSNRQIALALHLTEKTVKNYMTVIMEKLQVNNRVEAAILANQVGE
jgi:DNA-binding NarL/FixJ family response regulator